MDDALGRILCDVLSIPPERVDDSLTREDVDGWDSMTHLTLVLALEQAFGVSFEPEESAGLASVGAVREALAGKLAGVANREN